MHPAQIAEMLKDLSDQQLAGELQRPSGSVPQYMALAELSRRQRLRSSPQPQGPAPRQTIAQQLIAQIPPQPMPQMQRPVQRFQEGGLVEEDPYEMIASGLPAMGAEIPPPAMAAIIEDYRKIYPQKDYYAEARKGLAALEEQLSQRKGKAGKEALLQAGLAMLASRSPDFLRAAGQGGLAGLEGYQQARNQNMAMENALLNQREGLATREQGFREREPVNAYNLGMLDLQRRQIAAATELRKLQAYSAMAKAGMREEPTSETKQVPSPYPGLPPFDVKTDIPIQQGYNLVPGGAPGKRLVAPSAEYMATLNAKTAAARQSGNVNIEQQLAKVISTLAMPDLPAEERKSLESLRDSLIKAYNEMHPMRPTSSGAGSYQAIVDDDGGIKGFFNPATQAFVQPPVEGRKSQLTQGQYSRIVDENGNIVGYYNPRIDRMVPAPTEGGRGTAVPAGELEKRASLRDIIRQLDDLKVIAPKNKDSIGWFAGRIAGFKRGTVGVSPEVSDMFRISGNVADVLLRARSGAQINEAEFKRLMKLVPAPEQPYTTFKSNLRQFEKEVKSVFEKRSGHAMPGNSTPSAGDRIKVKIKGTNQKGTVDAVDFDPATMERQ